jgi:hypothetical protein
VEDLKDVQNVLQMELAGLTVSLEPAEVADNSAHENTMTGHGGGEALPNMLAYMSVANPDDVQDDGAANGDFGDERPGLATLMYKAPRLQQQINDRATAHVEKQRNADDAASKDLSMRTFGMMDGVFARCMLNIFGVIMFLRLGYVVGTAGLWLAMAIIMISSVITLSTTLSLSAITTNGQVVGGGAYLMISRALGPAYGGAIGVMFAVANAVSVSMYVLLNAVHSTETQSRSFTFSSHHCTAQRHNYTAWMSL